MKYALSTIGMTIIMALLILFAGSDASAGRNLSKDIAPDVPAETLAPLNKHSEAYFEGTGKKDLILIADTFCENSRKTFALLMKNMTYIRRIKVLLVARYPMLGSDIVASHVMRMHAMGKGAFALKHAFAFETPQEKGFKARRQALAFAEQTFNLELGKDEKPDTLPELQTVIENTKLAESVGYDGTPHLIVEKRVLHGYSRVAIKIMLKEDL